MSASHMAPSHTSGEPQPPAQIAFPTQHVSENPMYLSLHGQGTSLFDLALPTFGDTATAESTALFLSRNQAP